MCVKSIYNNVTESLSLTHKHHTLAYTVLTIKEISCNFCPVPLNSYYNDHSINKLNLAEGRIVYSCSFFNKIKSDESFHVQSVYPLLTAVSRTFSFPKVHVFSLFGLSFYLRISMANPCLPYLYIFFD